MGAAMLAFSSAARDCHSSLWIDVVPNKLEWGLDQLYEATSHLDTEGLLQLIARGKLISKKDRDAFQNSFFTLLPQLNELRALRDSVRSCGVAITMKNRGDHLQALDQFRSDVLQLRVTIHDRTIMASGECSLEHYLTCSDLHQVLSLLVHGGSGFGKSELTKLLFFTLSTQYLAHNAILWHCNTIDQIRAIKGRMKAGQILMLDEFDPVGAQIVHADANTIKVLLNAVSPGTVRARNEDVSLPSGLLRVLTSNAGSLDEWLAPLAAKPADNAAIVRRMATLHVTSSLWKTPGAARQMPAGRNGLTMQHSLEHALACVQSGL
jgi:hypothetical protein